MRNKMSFVAVILFSAVVCTGIAALMAAPPAAAGTCWKIDACNTCCQVGSKVICTQRLCS